MVERIIPEGYRLTPEYWGGHGSQDTCVIKPPLTREETQVALKGVNQLNKAYYQKTAMYVRGIGELNDLSALSEFTSGSVFTAATIPTGTVVRIKEEVALQFNGDGRTYSENDYLGVVYNAGNDEELPTALTYYWPPIKRNGVYLFMGYENPTINVGTVKHTKDLVHEGMLMDQMQRIVNVSVISIGLPQNQQVQRPRWNIPFFPRLAPTS